MHIKLPIETFYTKKELSLSKMLEINNWINEDLNQIRKILNKFKQPKTDEEIFYNLCFIILVPQCKFKAISIVVDKLKLLDFYNNDLDNLEDIIKPSRYKKRKTLFLKKMKTNFNEILRNLKNKLNDPDEARSYLSQNVSGISYKAASHFLRNMGIESLAIIDTHILKFLEVDYSWRYSIVENHFKEIAKGFDLTPAELDAIIWRRYANIPFNEFIF